MSEVVIPSDAKLGSPGLSPVDKVFFKEHAIFQAYANILYAEMDGKQLQVVAFTDLDGTANNEYVRESERIHTVGPAEQGFAMLNAEGIPVGIITARSYPEVEMYLRADALNIQKQGPIICEDGATIILPHLPRAERILRKRELENAGKYVYTIGKREAIVMSQITTEVIADLLRNVGKESLELHIISSCLPEIPTEELQQAAGHSTLQQAQMSRERLASAYAVGLSLRQLEILNREAAKYGIRVFTNPDDGITMLFGADSDKAKAFEFIGQHPNLFFGEHAKDGILPIYFGNKGVNDANIMREVIEEFGGTAVLVARQHQPEEENDWIWDMTPEEVPLGVIRTKRAHGEGVQQAIMYMLRELGITPQQ